MNEEECTFEQSAALYISIHYTEEGTHCLSLSTIGKCTETACRFLCLPISLKLLLASKITRSLHLHVHMDDQTYKCYSSNARVCNGKRYPHVMHTHTHTQAHVSVHTRVYIDNTAHTQIHNTHSAGTQHDMYISRMYRLCTKQLPTSTHVFCS